LDLSVYSFLSRFASNGLLNILVDFQENNNLLKGGLAFTMFAYLWFRTGPDQENRRRTIVAIFTGTLLALLVSRTIANIAPFRIRPMYDLSLPHHPFAFPTRANLEDWSSFPSDTAAYFFSLGFGLAYLLRRYAVLILLYVAAWICFPRVFLGVHYTSDIVVGAMIGITLAWISVRSKWLRTGVADRVLAFMDASPGIFYATAFLVCFEMAALFDDIRTPARQLFHALHNEHYRGLILSLLTGLGYFGAVLLAASVVILILKRRRNTL
jgi:undecaprenyl-diphosphatase